MNNREHALQRFNAVRKQTISIAAPLSEEDQCVQAMADTSPIKWHLGHTTWFFETVILSRFEKNHQAYNPQFLYHFNSYYESLGPRQPRTQRGLVTRPSNAEVRLYRQAIDEQMQQWILNAPEATWQQAFAYFELGLNHEQQHQELMLTDLKFMLYQHPFEEIYIRREPQEYKTELPELSWVKHEGGVEQFGHGGSQFCFDNETPNHARMIYPHRLASRLLTCGEYLEFIEDGGYRTPAHWLSDGWARIQESQNQMPLYWRHSDQEGWQVFTLHGFQTLNLNEPVVHLNYYEACAYAAWAGARLPTEFELELALRESECLATHLDMPGVLHPTMAQQHGKAIDQGFGACWQWSTSAYEAYPKFQPFSGAVAEYNGKFMVGQQVLRGSSFATPAGHARASYRNFFPPAAQWQFTGLRLAKD